MVTTTHQVVGCRPPVGSGQRVHLARSTEDAAPAAKVQPFRTCMQLRPMGSDHRKSIGLTEPHAGKPALLWAALGDGWDIAPLSRGVDSWASTLRGVGGAPKCRRLEVTCTASWVKRARDAGSLC